MDFLTPNIINTTTMITVNSNTTTVANLFNPDVYFQYFSDGLNNDATISTITITFDNTTSISRIALLDTNIKSFTVFYNGSTASTFTLLNANTTTSNYSTNTQENLYFKFSTVQASSITIDMKTTQTANQEKRLGNLIISDTYYTLSRLPEAGGYKPKIESKQVVHKMSDGGTRIHNIRKKFALDISLDYLSETDRDNLKDIYELQNTFVFCPFGTTTGWDGVIFDSVWEGDFSFLEYSDNASTSGFSGKIKLRESAG